MLCLGFVHTSPRGEAGMLRPLSAVLDGFNLDDAQQTLRLEADALAPLPFGSTNRSPFPAVCLPTVKVR